MADRTALIRDLPKNEDDPGTCLTSGDADLGDCLWTPLEASAHDADVSRRGGQATGTDVVDPTRWVCWERECPVVIGDVISYRDRGHLTTVYSESLADELGREMGSGRTRPQARAAP